MVTLPEDERQYCYQALDQFASTGKVVGVLKEFWEDQMKTSLL